MVSADAIAEPRSLFDGKTLNGWEVRPSEAALWRVVDGAIAGGSLDQQMKHNTFIATRESFHNFELKLKIRLRGGGGPGLINSGIQIRSIRVPKNHEMRGYQVDAGDGWWGKMYDESRRNRVIAEAKDLASVNAAVRKNDWNEFRIRAEGKRIQSWINGVAAIDYLEQQKDIPLDGKIGVQVHGGGKAMVELKDVTIEVLPPTPNAITWEKLSQTAGQKSEKRHVVANQLHGKNKTLSPAQEQAGFHVPDNFTVELVAAESDSIGKFVAVAFDDRGRLWTMTALEYPLDANEQPEVSRRKFSEGGIDKVLVIDRPFDNPPSKPRVFADGLVMPLGILPYGDGCYVQYGNDIRFYHDTDADGKADTHKVVLTGFGTQDSHLFPHQFTRSPGGWILMAQGLFNDSTVRRPDGKPFASGANSVRFRHCKLARFRPDGSDFELLTQGPNNIWGLTISREGETWIQEANDLGYPIIPFEPGGYYRTGSRDLLKPYQPLTPPTITPPQMGGTGLSGLALADDKDGWPGPWGRSGATADAAKVFYVANPITSRIQTIRAMVDGERYRYEKGEDFLMSADPNFRPVAIQFGPDGCLYIVDWYNKIISHNEVPRNHPERNKTHGRIWRIRHEKQSVRQPIDLASATNEALLNALGEPNARLARLAWQQIIDRDAKELIPELAKLSADATAPSDKRCGAIWAMEGLQTVPTELLVSLAKDPNANIRHEAIRIASAQTRPDAEFAAVASLVIDDPAPKVRAALCNGLRHLPKVNENTIELMVRLCRPSISGSPWDVYDREFERFLVRWALERHPGAVSNFLASERGHALPLENRIVATLALPQKEAALGLARLLPQLKRSLSEGEVRVLASQFQQPQVAEAVRAALKNDDSRAATLASLYNLRTALALDLLNDDIVAATESLWAEANSPTQRELTMNLAGAFRVTALQRPLAELAIDPNADRQQRLAALRASREMQSTEAKLIAKLVSDSDDAIRKSALAVLAESHDDDATAVLLGLFYDLGFSDRAAVIDQLASTREGAAKLLDAVADEDVEPDDIPVSALEKMRELLPEDKLMANLWREVANRLDRVLQLSGSNHDYGPAVTLQGPFTVETWIRLAPGISNADGILGRANVADFNFFDSHFRVWIQGARDIAICKSKMKPDTWTHYAVTRDSAGIFRIYVNGELDVVSVKKNLTTFANLNVGRTMPDNVGTDGSLAEFRVWNMARTATEIRDHFDRGIEPDERFDGLVHLFRADQWSKLHGNAEIAATLDAPKLLTASEAEQQAAKFAKFRALVAKAGNAEHGRTLFKQKCMVCHSQGGTGGKIGPPLDGIGLTGTEAILRNVVTPSAAMEGGYRNFRVVTRRGRILQGLLVAQDDDAIVLRRPDTADIRIPASDVTRATFTRTSVMPEGILDMMEPTDVSSLFTYLKSLTVKK